MSVFSNASMEAFLEKSRQKQIKFSRRDPGLWRELLTQATPQTLTVCKHLEGVEEDKACKCGFPGAVWADGEHVLFTMGDVWGNEPSMQAPRIERSVEIATAQLLTCLYNNADWLIKLAAQADRSPEGGDREGGSIEDESPVPEGNAP